MRLNHPDDLRDLLGVPFTPEQLAAVTADLAPGVIIAGAGSGKTTVMTARVVWLVGTGAVRPDQVLGLTFTNKAAGELAARVRKALPSALAPDAPAHDLDDESAGEPVISTYHAFAGRLLQEHGLRIGLEPSARLLADATRFQLAAQAARRAPGPFPTLTQPLASITADVLALAGEMAEHLVDPAALRRHDLALVAEVEAAAKTSAAARQAADAARRRLDLVQLVEAYQAAKASRDLLDFGDQIALAARLAEERPEVGEILRDTHRVVLLDEYQDTSVAQRRLLAGLFGQGHAVTAVGDPCQAIYGWRGASVANLMRFHDHFPARPGQRAGDFRLLENRRSGGRILSFANRLSADLPERRDGAVAELRPGPGADLDGRARCALLTTHDAEIAWIADQVRDVIGTVHTDAGEPIGPGDVAVLARTASEFADIHAALTARDVPVEVVGLSGLLHLPEVADLVAACEVLDDPTANSALVRLLTGPRWRIGPRDLALLGKRAGELVRYDRHDPDSLDARLEEAVAGIDPTEVVSLSDALADPGDDLPFSAAARVRFARLAAEIRELRRHLGEPLMDVLHRTLAATGLDVELSASPGALAARRRETLHAFLDVASGFADLDGDPSLTAFLAFLRTAEAHDRGLDGSLPSAGDSVKVLTAHRSKGLEWAVVVVPGLVKGVFPSTRAQTLWTKNGKALPYVLRGDVENLPTLPDLTAKGFKAFESDSREHQAEEELRLGYVTFTRPKHLLIASGHWWGPTQKTPRGPSPFLDRLREHCEAGNGEVVQWAPTPPEDANPHLDGGQDVPWPLPLEEHALAARRAAADAVLAELAARHTGEQEAYEPEEQYEPYEPDDEAFEPPPDDAYEDGGWVQDTLDTEPLPVPVLPTQDLTGDERAVVASWDRDLTRLADELMRARSGVREVPLPVTLSASQVLRLAADPDGLARELARPMPRPPAPAARRGTRFHAWVESLFGERPLLEPDDLPGAADEEIDDEADLVDLQQAFLRTSYAHRAPYRVETPFQLLLGGRIVRGRIDAVYRDDDGGYEVVDWKTNRGRTADPLQLAVYRLAWAELAGVPADRVTASFLYVRTGEVVRPTGLPGRAGLEALLGGGEPVESVMS